MQDHSILLQTSDLNGNGGVYCPNPKTGFQNAAPHPRVFLDIAGSGRAACPYCGTVYLLSDKDESPAGTH